MCSEDAIDDNIPIGTCLNTCYRIFLKARGGEPIKSYSSREIIKMLEEDGWYFTGARGDHHYFEHDTKKGKITVPHPEKDIHPKTSISILKQAGLK